MHAQTTLVVLLLQYAQLACCYPQHQWHHRQRAPDSILEEYDYIVVGGGQSGLVVANRLSENENSTVLVVEYGYFDTRPEQIQPPSVRIFPPQDLYNLTSVPQEGLGGSLQQVLSACVVGGGSTINGMMLTRGAADDYNNWAKLNNDPSWGFEGLLPYFVKALTFEEPPPSLTEDFNITWDASVYGEDSPIHVSISPFQWPGTLPQFQGMEDVGVVAQTGGASGNAHGVFWYQNALDNTTVTRSYAVSGYYTPVANRTNLHLLTGHRVNEILFDEKLHISGVRIQTRGLTGDEGVSIIRARNEIVLAAGALHSPQVLQRSGIGPAALLESAGIDVLVDLPGVGSNLQDHPNSRVTFNYTKDLEPNPQDLTSNQSFIDWAQELWTSNRTGPLSMTYGNTISLIPLQQATPDRWEEIISTLEGQNSSDYLPEFYTEEQRAGFEEQRLLLADSWKRTDNAAIEVPFHGAASFSTVVAKVISRGTVLLNPEDIYAEPIFDFGTFTNPVDAILMAESYAFVRRWHQTAIIKDTFAPVEVVPGTNITTLDDLVATARISTSSTTGHLAGTCALTPRHLGGVVGTDLRVYGVTGLSVVDASVMPLIPGAHLCATVYAVAEKAADMIKSRHS